MSAHPPQEPDRIPTAKIVVVAAVLIAITFGCLLWVALLLPRPGEPLPALGAHLDETLFSRGEGAGILLRRQQEARLQSYGTVDAARGTVHIPITRAMELVAAEGAP